MSDQVSSKKSTREPGVNEITRIAYYAGEAMRQMQQQQSTRQSGGKSDIARQFE